MGERQRTKLGVPALSAVDDMIARPGVVIEGRYHLVRKIGEGGMGEIWEASQPRLERRVALKLLREDSASTEDMRRFVREANIVSGISHPNIVPVHDTGWYEGLPYLVMPLLDGTDLDHELDRVGCFGLEAVVALLAGPASALDAVHEAGVIHRDLKPSNLFLTRDADGQRVQILDFGLAVQHAAQGRLTRRGFTVGTPEYMAPELVSGSATMRSDVYALATVAFEMLTGDVPFIDSRPLQVLARKMDADAPALSERGFAASPELELVFRAGLAKDPAARHSSASAFIDALRECLRHSKSERRARPKSAVIPLVRPRPSRRQSMRARDTLPAVELDEPALAADEGQPARALDEPQPALDDTPPALPLASSHRALVLAAIVVVLVVLAVLALR